MRAKQRTSVGLLVFNALWCSCKSWASAIRRMAARQSSCNFISYSYSLWQCHGLIKYIDTKAKCCHLKNWPVNGLCGRCLSVCGPLPSYDRIPSFPPYTLYTCTVYSILIHRGKGGGVEPERRLERQLLTKLGRKYQHDWLYLQSINSYKHLQQSPFSSQLF